MHTGRAAESFGCGMLLQLVLVLSHDSERLAKAMTLLRKVSGKKAVVERDLLWLMTSFKVVCWKIIYKMSMVSILIVNLSLDPFVVMVKIEGNGKEE
jgi:hypothetical protein